MTPIEASRSASWNWGRRRVFLIMIPPIVTACVLAINGNYFFALSIRTPNRQGVKMNGLMKNGTVYTISKQAAAQVESYRNRSGIILNIHVTHQAGTVLCSSIGRSPEAYHPAPEFACMIRKKDVVNWTDASVERNPWTHNQTHHNIELVRDNYHMISWEYRFAPFPSLSETNWEDPNLVSIYITKDPIQRLLSGGSSWQAKHAPNLLKNGTHQQWYAYANNTEKSETNNYALQVLTNHTCCSGENTDPRYLENAKKLLQRFSFVLDVECLDEGMEALADLLGLSVVNYNPRLHHTHNQSARERIGYDDVYEYLLRRNKPAIELHEFAKTISLVDCSSIKNETRGVTTVSV